MDKHSFDIDRRDILKSVAGGGLIHSGVGSVRVSGKRRSISEQTDTSEVHSRMTGEGTTRDPYIITTLEELESISEETGSHYELGNDIDATDETWGTEQQIASDRDPFIGELNGNGYEIRGLRISAGLRAGLFDVVQNGALIRDLRLINVRAEGRTDVGPLAAFVGGGTIQNIHAQTSAEGESLNVSALVGRNMGGVIRDSFVDAIVGGEERIGGVAGINNSVIKSTVVEGGVSGRSEGNHVGGLAGRNGPSGIILDSSTDMTVNGQENVGGLVGANDGGFIHNSSASSVVNGSENVGGLVGANQYDGYLVNCHADGPTTGDTFIKGNRVGGLVGRNGDTLTDGGRILHCVATGDVQGNSAIGGLAGRNTRGTITGSHATGSTDGNFRVGGLVGRSRDQGKIHSSYATGTVDGDNRVGGLVGQNAVESEVHKSYASGIVDGGDRTGGLVGVNAFGGNLENDPDPVVISDSYATGTVAGNTAVGGLVGVNKTESEVHKSYATGDVDGDSRIGGLVGTNEASNRFSDSGTVNESYAVGSISGTENVGGLVGLNREADAVSDSYWETAGADHSPGGTELTATDMQGSAAKTHMSGFDFENTWNTEVDPAAYPSLQAAACIEQPPRPDPDYESRTMLTFDATETSSWTVATVGDDIGEHTEINPTVIMEPGVQYLIINDGWSTHPLALQDSNQNMLLSQDGSGRFEDDPEVEWVHEGKFISFILTPALADEVDRYTCTTHDSMTGEIRTDRDHESDVSQELFDAVDQSGDGELSLGELQDAVEDWSTNQQIDGVETSLDDLRLIVDWWAS